MGGHANSQRAGRRGMMGGGEGQWAKTEGKREWERRASHPANSLFSLPAWLAVVSSSRLLFIVSSENSREASRPSVQGSGHLARRRGGISSPMAHPPPLSRPKFHPNKYAPWINARRFSELITAQLICNTGRRRISILIVERGISKSGVHTRRRK